MGLFSFLFLLSANIDQTIVELVILGLYTCRILKGFLFSLRNLSKHASIVVKLHGS